MTSPDRPPSLGLGARCLVGGKFKATVRYIGPVDGQAGEWVGLEWDDASRGKHDGSHGGRRYFACRPGPPAGSFVRLAKLLETADFGCSLLEALERRYAGGGGGSGGGGRGGGSADGGNEASGGGEEGLFLLRSGGRRLAVELVGATQVARRLSDLSALQKCSVVGEGVAHLDGTATLASRLPALVDLDLSDNLVGDWAFAIGLLHALPSLRTLNLSRNHLALPPAPLPLAALPPPLQLPSLATLVLNGCGVGWGEAVAVAQQLPGLTELHLCGNGIASLWLPVPALGSSQEGAKEGGREEAGPEGGGGAPGGAEALLGASFGRLEILDLDENQLGDWGDVQLLRSLPLLRTLLLSGNALPTVQYTHGFSSLSSLLLGRNRLSDWGAVDQLDRFPALAEARLSDNPLLAQLGSTGRYEVIARVGRLATLNASQVTKMERWDAELNYLRHITDELAAAADEPARQAALRAHPRFAALTQKYGSLAPSAPPPAAGSSLARSMVEVTLSHGGKELKKKLPVSLTVGKLKLMVEKLLKVKAAQQALLLLPPAPEAALPPAAEIEAAAGAAGAAAPSGEGEEAGEGQPEDITEEDGRELRYFDIKDGSRIEVTAADPSARAEALQRAKQAAAELHRLRMADQEKMIQQFRLVEKGLMA